jgi:hypothetical protein
MDWLIDREEAPEAARALCSSDVDESPVLVDND